MTGVFHQQLQDEMKIFTEFLMLILEFIRAQI